MKKSILILCFFINFISFAQYRIQQPTSSFNVELAEKTLSTLQNRYDANHQRVKDAEQQCSDFIATQVKKYNKDYNTYIKINNRFVREYVNPVRREGYDYSNTNLTNKVIDFLIDGTQKILLEEL